MMTSSTCSPLHLSFAIYGSIPFDNCILLATRDSVTVLLWPCALALARKMKAKHNAEFATFVFCLCMIGSIIWAELLALAVINFAVYKFVEMSAYTCEWMFRERITNEGKTHMLTSEFNDPASIRMQTPIKIK